MKIIVTKNVEGHFLAKPIEDRKGVLELLYKIHDGAYFSDITKDYNLKFKANLDEYSDEKWESILYTFVQRGTVEIIKISKTLD